MKIKKYITPNLIKLYALNLSLVFVEIFYLAIRFKNIKNQIPFWYTMPWGQLQLANKSNLFLIPLLSVTLITIGIFLDVYTKIKYYRFGPYVIRFLVSLMDVLLGISFFRIIRISTYSFKSLINPEYLNLIPPVLLSFSIVYLITPYILKYLTKKGIVTDPKQHNHPGMLLKNPSARGGGLIFVLGFIISSLFFVQINSTMVYLYISLTLAAILGILDDIQNTRGTKILKKIEKPLFRFFLQALIILPLVIAGTQIKIVSNPLNGIIQLDSWKTVIFGRTLYPLATTVTIIWMLWIMNLLSWSNGVDGQFSGIVGIAGIIIAIIALRNTPLPPQTRNVVNISAIAAGASLGLLPYNWYPSKIMWGFGAISAGIVLATASVLTQTKIATGIIVLLIPFLDGIVTIIRRIIQNKTPLKGDRGHLHHLLIKRGWGIRRVAVFYWLVTALTGYVGIKSADKDPFLAILTLSGLSAFFIILINLKPKKRV